MIDVVRPDCVHTALAFMCAAETPLGVITRSRASSTGANGVVRSDCVHKALAFMCAAETPLGVLTRSRANSTGANGANNSVPVFENISRRSS